MRIAAIHLRGLILLAFITHLQHGRCLGCARFETCPTSSKSKLCFPSGLISSYASSDMRRRSLHFNQKLHALTREDRQHDTIDPTGCCITRTLIGSKLHLAIPNSKDV